jgi:apolipoprotein N-acyltransferase
MKGRRIAVLGVVVIVLSLGILLAALSLSLTPTARLLLVLTFGVLLAIGISVGGFVWWVRRELGPGGPSEEVQERVERRMDDREE